MFVLLLLLLLSCCCCFCLFVVVVVSALFLFFSSFFVCVWFLLFWGVFVCLFVCFVCLFLGGWEGAVGMFGGFVGVGVGGSSVTAVAQALRQKELLGIDLGDSHFAKENLQNDTNSFRAVFSDWPP